MRKRLKYLILSWMIFSLAFLTGCGNGDGKFDLLTDFIQTIPGYIIIGGIVLFLMFKYGGKNK